MCSSVDLNVPVQRAWEVIANANRWPEWSEVCSAVWDAPQGIEEWKVGTAFGFRLKMAKRDIPFNVTVTRIEHGHRADPVPIRIIEWISTKFTITATRSISVVSFDSGEQVGALEKCRVVDRKRFSGSLLPIGLAYPRWLIRRMTESWLQDLKLEAE